MITRQDIVVNRHGARFLGHHIPCAIGRGGIPPAKREGDGATPAGTHRIPALLYRPDRIARAALPPHARPIGPRDLWSDDPAAPDYNHLTLAPPPYSHENLRRAAPLYDLILTTDWNWPRAHPGRGAAIFLHQWRAPRFPTAGCVAFSRADLLWIAQNLTPATRLIIRA